MTIRREFDLLEKEGLVQREAGPGTFAHDSRTARPVVTDVKLLFIG